LSGSDLGAARQSRWLFNGGDIDRGPGEQRASEDSSEFDQFPYHDALRVPPVEGRVLKEAF
jgi:hypothetical protein